MRSMVMIMRRVLPTVAICFVTLAVWPTISVAVTASPGWAVKVVAMPTDFSAADNASCTGNERCDRYSVIITNVGGAETSGRTLIRDMLPSAEVAVFRATVTDLATNNIVECPLPSGSTLECAYEGQVRPGGSLVAEVEVLVGASSAKLEDRVEVEGGGAKGIATAVGHNEANVSGPPTFGVTEFDAHAYGTDGELDEQAGGHPETVAVGFELANVLDPASNIASFLPVEEPKTVTVELPVGLVNDPQAVG
jgi:hypothetical protein